MWTVVKSDVVAFWFLGLLNNSGSVPCLLRHSDFARHNTLLVHPNSKRQQYAGYVIMIAGANEISSGSVGLVYFCAIFPALLVKLSAPYW